MEEEKSILEYRMYCLVLKELSSINKACQGIHSCLEYANKFGNDPDYQQYVNIDKTLIMLDGGTYPDLCEIVKTLQYNDIKFSCFKEPDLGYIYTAITFLVDNRIWYKTYYKTYDEYCFNLNLDKDSPQTYANWLSYIGGAKNLVLLDIIKDKRLSL